MTRRGYRPLIYLLVILLVTWGTCPCVFAQMLGLRGEAAASQDADAPVSVAPC